MRIFFVAICYIFVAMRIFLQQYVIFCSNMLFLLRYIIFVAIELVCHNSKYYLLFFSHDGQSIQYASF